MRRLLTSALAAVMIAAMAVTASVADPGRDDPSLRAWEATVPPEVVQELHDAGIEVSSQVAVGDLVKIEVVARSRQLEPFRGPDVTFDPTRGQVMADRARGFAVGDGVYRPYDGPNGIEAELLAIAAANPDLVKLVDIGDTHQGRDIWALKVSKNANQRPDGQRPAVLYSSTQHAREWITVEMNRRLLHYFLDNYGSDPQITRLIDRNELWFVVVANPDGYQYTHTTERLWRKNLRDNDGDGEITGADGVDLNRNFPFKWGYDNEGSSEVITSQVYRGPEPLSEPETRALDGLMARVGFEFQINYHSAAELLLYGNGWQVSTPSPDDAVYTTLAGTDAEPAIPGYDPDLSAELYTTNGETTNHAHAVYGTLAFTPEMSTCQTASNVDPNDEWVAGDCQSVFNFPDDEALIQAEFEKNLPFALDVAKSASDPDEPVSHLGNVAPSFVMDPFALSYGGDQTVQVIADRDLGPVRMYYTINDGHFKVERTHEWDGGERYGDNFGFYYHYLRGTVPGAEPGDEVTVWFEARGSESESFTYTVADDVGGDVLVVANTNYGRPISGGATELRYLDYYADSIEATGRTWDLYDVTAYDRAPHPLGVLSHYDTVIWYTGDNLVTDYQGGINTTKLAHDMNIVLRDHINQGGSLLATGKNMGFQAFFGLAYGENGDPETPCTSGDCLFLSNDFFQYYLGGYERARRGGLGSDGEAKPVNGIGVPYTGFNWTLDGGDSAHNQGEAGGTNDTGTGTASWVSTSDVLPADEFPLFASVASAEWEAGAQAPFEPLTGSFYMASQAADISYKRLTRTVDLTGASSGAIEVAVSYDTEANWDFAIVEAHTVGQDDWTTLPIAGVTSQDTGDSCPSGWQDLHPFLAHYQTFNPDGTCSPTGTTGVWHAVSGTGPGWQTWAIDLSAYAGSQVEVSISYVSDWSTQELGVFVDDASVLVDGAVVSETSFEQDTGGWSVPGPPPGSAPNPNDWIRSETLVRFMAAVTTDHSILHGFGFEGISTEAERNEVMNRSLDHLAP